MVSFFRKRQWKACLGSKSLTRFCEALVRILFLIWPDLSPYHLFLKVFFNLYFFLQSVFFSSICIIFFLYLFKISPLYKYFPLYKHFLLYSSSLFKLFQFPWMSFQQKINCFFISGASSGWIPAAVIILIVFLFVDDDEFSFFVELRTVFFHNESYFCFSFCFSFPNFASLSSLCRFLFCKESSFFGNSMGSIMRETVPSVFISVDTKPLSPWNCSVSTFLWSRVHQTLAKLNVLIGFLLFSHLFQEFRILKIFSCPSFSLFLSICFRQCQST